MPIFWTFTGSLDEFKVVSFCPTPHFIRHFRSGKPCPASLELCLGNGLPSLFVSGLAGEGNQQIKTRSSVDIANQFTGEVFGVCNDEC